MEKHWKTEGPASCDCSLHSSSNMKLIRLLGSPGWRLPKLCLEQAVSWLQGKQVKANRDVAQSWNSKGPARKFLASRKACRVCQKPRNNSTDRNNETDPPLNSAKRTESHLLKKKEKLTRVYSQKGWSEHFSFNACNKKIPLTSLPFCFVKTQKVQTCKNMVIQTFFTTSIEKHF